MAFALFTLLAPAAEAVAQGQRLFPADNVVARANEVIIRWADGLSLMVGTCALAVPLAYAPFMFLSDFLRKKKTAREENPPSQI